MFAVSEDYFRRKRQNNPENLRNRCDFCKSPQPRYKPHPNIKYALLIFKYMPYTKCLPGCFAVKSSTVMRLTYYYFGFTENVSMSSDMQCETYDSRDGGKQISTLENKRNGKNTLNTIRIPYILLMCRTPAGESGALN